MNHLLYVLAFGACIFIALRGVQNLSHFVKNVRLFIDARSDEEKHIAARRHYYMVIPALREQAVISDTLRYFAKLKLDTKAFSVIVATTRRETYEHESNFQRLASVAKDLHNSIPLYRFLNKYAGVFDRLTLTKLWEELHSKPAKSTLGYIEKLHASYELTGQLVQALADEINGKMGRSDFIQLIEYPHTEGLVAHQINFAINSLTNRSSHDYIGIYNADSRPPLDTLIQAEEIIQVRSSAHTPVIQQSSLFTLNVNNDDTSYSGKANAIHQSLWTLKHEITMLRLQSKHAPYLDDHPSILQQLWHTRFTVCVCHGLFINSDYYDKLPLPENSVIEDTSYGLLQCLNHTPVVPLYALENSESPTSLTAGISQKRTWFRLVFDLWDINISALKRETSTESTSLEILVLMARITPIYIFWFFHTLVVVFPLLVVIYLHNPWLFCTWLLTLFIYWLVPALILDANLPNLVGQKKLGSIKIVKIFILGMPGILTHSVGPWLSVYDGIRKKFGITIEKKKTER
jgi:cellulose synthase/poly-beta-1,6-N-acetylglucosamine synthase-like glycosyltransferase